MSTATAPRADAAHTRSKAVAAWLAVLLGTFGAHRFYLHGWRDAAGWLHAVAALLGLVGVARLRNLGQDDRTAWLLLPWLGLAISAAMLAAIVHALTPDARWSLRHSPRQPSHTGWAAVLAAVAALLLGSAALLSTLAFAIQKFFEWQFAA